MKTARQITISMPNVPGSIARMCDTLRGNRINIEAISCSSSAETTDIHIIVDEPEKAAMSLNQLGKLHMDEVLMFDRPNKQGEIFEIARLCAGANVNIRNIYTTSHGGPKTRMDIYMEVDDVEKAKTILKDIE